MLIRTAALTLAAAFSAVGVARADLWVNLKGTVSVYQDGDKCTLERYNHREAVYSCRGAGRITVGDWDRTTNKTCLVRWWTSGSGHWHYSIDRDDLGCKGHWQNSNTLDITLKR